MLDSKSTLPCLFFRSFIKTCSHEIAKKTLSLITFLLVCPIIVAAEAVLTTPQLAVQHKPAARPRRTFQPKSLGDQCITAIAQNSNRLLPDNKYFGTCMALPDSVLLRLIKRMVEKAQSRRSPCPLDAVTRESLERVLVSDTIDTDRACAIWVAAEPLLTCQKLQERIARHIQAGKPITPSICTVICHSFKSGDILTRSFKEIFPYDFANHKQAGEITAAFMNLHIARMQPMEDGWPQTFALRRYRGEVPSNLVFNAPTYNVTNEIAENHTVLETADTVDYVILPHHTGAKQGDCPGALSSDKSFFAISRGIGNFAAVIELTKLKRGVDDEGFEILNAKQILHLLTPNNFLNAPHVRISFSSNDEWLKVENGERVLYFRLPLKYMRGDLTVEQIAYVRILQECGILHSMVPYEGWGLDIVSTYKLLTCPVLQSFAPCEKELFEQAVSANLVACRKSRSVGIKRLSNQNPNDIPSVLNQYFLLNEQHCLLEDLAQTEDEGIRLLKKICKGMLNKLKEVYKHEDFAQFDCVFRNQPDFKQIIREKIRGIFARYLTLQEHMTPEDFKRNLTELISGALIQCRAY